MHVGSQVSSSTELARVCFRRPLQARAFVGQEQVASLKPGQQVVLTIHGHDDETLSGTIVSVATDPAEATGGSSSGPSHEVLVRLTDLPDFARQGMTGSLTVRLARRTDVLVVPTSAVVGSGSRSRSSMRWSVTPAPSILSSITLDVQDGYSGLLAGEKVVTGIVEEDGGTRTSGGGFRAGPGRPEGPVGQ